MTTQDGIEYKLVTVTAAAAASASSLAFDGCCAAACSHYLLLLLLLLLRIPSLHTTLQVVLGGVAIGELQLFYQTKIIAKEK